MGPMPPGHPALAGPLLPVGGLDVQLASPGLWWTPLSWDGWFSILTARWNHEEPERAGAGVLLPNSLGFWDDAWKTRFLNSNYSPGNSNIQTN